jgi:hypothetical protein
MSRKTWLLGVAITLTIVYIYFCITYDKAGLDTPALLCGLPVWIVAGIGAGVMLVSGANWNPVKDPGAYGDTPDWIFWLFGLLFFAALFMGTYFTEPIVCTARDGDVCYESQTAYEVRRNNGSTYNGYYRNSNTWSTWRLLDNVADTAVYSGYGGGGSSGGGDGWLSNMDIDDSEAVIFIVVVVVIIMLVLASAFVPNLWVLACGLCLVGFCLTILRLHRQEVLYNGRKIEEPSTRFKLDLKTKNDPLLADPPEQPTTPDMR